MSEANCNNRLVRCPFCGCLPKAENSRSDWIRETYYVVACRSVRCHVNPETHPCDNKGELATTRKDAVARWNNSLKSNAEDRRASQTNNKMLKDTSRKQRVTITGDDTGDYKGREGVFHYIDDEDGLCTVTFGDGIPTYFQPSELSPI